MGLATRIARHEAGDVSEVARVLFRVFKGAPAGPGERR
jgi:hypothetical protein